MRSVLSFIFCLAVSNYAFASAETDSEMLSQSFNTIPLGRTSHGFVTVKEGEQEAFEAKEKARLYSCSQDQSQCLPPVAKQQTPTSKGGKKSTLGKVKDALLE